MKNYQIPHILLHKTILIFCFIIISTALLLMKNVVVTGYESSIYKSISFPIFLLLIPMIYSMTNVFIFKLKGNFLILNLILFLIIGLVILSIPSIKGYSFYPMGDTPTHIGIVLDLISYNQITGGLIYPIEHILITSLYYISNIDPVKIMAMLPLFYSIISIMYLYILANYVFNDSNKAILTIFIGFFSLTTDTIKPHIFAVLTMPLVLFILLRIINHNSIGNKLLLLIFATLYPFFHPLVEIVFIMSILLIGILYRFLNGNRLTNIVFMSIPFISLIIFFLWLWHNLWFWNNNIGRVVRWFFQETVDKGRYQDVISIFSEYSINPLNLVIKVYGQDIIYIIFSFLVIFLIIKKMKIFRIDEESVDRKILFLSGWLVINVFMGFVLLFLPSFGGPERMLYYASIMAPIFVAYFFFNLKKNITKNIMAIILMILIINSVFSVYQSDYMYLPNLQVTNMELVGSSWLIDHKESDLKVRSNHERFYRITDLIKGRIYSRKYDLVEVRKNSEYRTAPLNHFGYDIYKRMGDIYKKDTYLILEKYDEAIYFDLYPNSIKFNKIDFDNLDIDTTVDKIYNNGEFRVRLIKSTL